MRRYGVLLLVLVLAVTSLLAAAAYNVAMITNAATIKVVSTDNALLALHPGAGFPSELPNGNRDATVTIDDNELLFRFGVGFGDAFYGLQPDSEYVWFNPFHIHNNSNEYVKITVTATGDIAQYVYFGCCDWSVFTHAFPHYPAHPATEWHQSTETYDDPLMPQNLYGGVMSIGMPAIKIVIPDGVDPASLSGSIIVKGEAVSPYVL